MEWLIVILLLISNVILTVCFRGETRSDWRLMDINVSRMSNENRKTNAEMNAKIQDLNIRLLRQDAEFKARLCAIENIRSKS